MLKRESQKAGEKFKYFAGKCKFCTFTFTCFVTGGKKAEMILNSHANPVSKKDQCLVTNPQSDSKKFFCKLLPVPRSQQAENLGTRMV